MHYASFPFFLYLFRPHRDLHSFPTRRSSDLSPNDSSALERQRISSFSSWMAKRLSTSFGSGLKNNLTPNDVERRFRSEEHTSELQSRRDLVCRLLLEKKKKKQTPRK